MPPKLPRHNRASVMRPRTAHVRRRPVRVNGGDPAVATERQLHPTPTLRRLHQSFALCSRPIFGFSSQLVRSLRSLVSSAKYSRAPKVRRPSNGSLCAGSALLAALSLHPTFARFPATARKQGRPFDRLGQRKSPSPESHPVPSGTGSSNPVPSSGESATNRPGGRSAGALRSPVRQYSFSPVCRAADDAALAQLSVPRRVRDRREVWQRPGPIRARQKLGPLTAPIT